MPDTLTIRQHTILDCVMRHWVKNLVGPSIRELVRALDWCYSTSQMHAELQTLIYNGYLMRPKNYARSLVPLRDCDGTEISIIMRRADGVEVQLPAL